MTVWLCLTMSLLGIQTATAAWQQVFIPIDGKSDLPRVAQAIGGFDPCGTIFSEDGVELPVDDQQFAALNAAGLRPQVRIADLEQYYTSRMGADRNYGAYHTYSEGMDEINQLHTDFPDLVGAPFSIGTTGQGNTIWAFKVSDNPEVDEDEPEVLFGSYIHAREAITIEVLLHFVHHLTDNYGTDTRVTEIVNGRELWFIPFMNPDGVLYNESTNPGGGGMWRKNRRNNGSSMGVDLNRNFPYQWGYDNIGSSPSGSDETYRGPSASSEPETNAIRAFVNSRPIVAMQSYHSYSNLMLYPYGYADIQCEEPWHTGYVTMTDLLSAGNGYATGTAWELLYNTNGDAVDWGHGATGEHPRIMTITTEVGSGSDGFWPAESRIPALVAENLEPNLLFAEMAGNPWSALPPAAPSLAEPGAVGSNYTLSWNTPSPDPNNPALSYDVQQLGGLSQGSDDFSSTTNWTPGGTPFVLSAARAFSAPSSYYGGTGNNRNAISTLSGSLQVTPGMQVSLRAWYDIENDWDYAYVELSTNGVSWSPIAGSITTNSNPNGTNEGNGITGGSAGFVAATFPLAAWVGQTVQLRLRYRTDGAVLGEGIYIDDFAPVQTFTSSQIIATGVTTESFDVLNQSDGTWYHRVRALDAEGDFSGWSNLVVATVSGGEDTTPPSIVHTGLGDTMDSAGPWSVTATITDYSGVAQATLEQRINGGAWQPLAMSASGDLWSAELQGPAAPGSLVEYHIIALDAASMPNSATSPDWSFHILAPVGLEYCQDFSGGLNDFTEARDIAGGNTWGPGSINDHSETAYIQYTSTIQEDHASLYSPVFDCSGQATVQLSFWMHLRMGYSGYWTHASLQGSVDGGASWPYVLGQWDEDGVGDETLIEGVQTLDLSPWAAGQANVRLRFEYNDLYDWYWHVDDVCLLGTLAVTPDPVVASIVANGSDMDLSWTAVPGATSYNVYSSAVAGSGYTLVAHVNGTSWTDSGAASQPQLFYVVTADTAARSMADPASIPVLDPSANRRSVPHLNKPID